MKKIFALLPILLLASCTGNSPVTTTSSDTPSGENIPAGYENWSYTEPEEEAIVVSKEGVEISSLEVIDVPSEGIKVACWNDHEIKLKVLYSDNSTETIRILEKHIPIEYRHFLGEVGHHTITLVINASMVNFGFDIIENKEFHGYKCAFFDYRSGAAKELYSTTVGYYASVSYAGDPLESKVIDQDTIQSFIGWDYPLTCISQDMNYKAQFRDTLKRYYGDNIKSESDMLIASSKKEHQNHALSYLGRIHAVPVNYGEVKFHNQGSHEEAELTFTPLNPYGVKWAEMNQNIIKHGIHYAYKANYGTYVYNTTGAFGESATILNNFESYYDVASQNKTLETDERIDTSIASSFGTCYAVSEANMSATKIVEDNMESGYYRIALTMSFDVYASLTFTKVTGDRYNLEAGSKFIFAPVEQTKAVRLDFSVDKSFGNPFEKPLTFSTENLYNIAESLEW